jgi:hypothetical protein
MPKKVTAVQGGNKVSRSYTWTDYVVTEVRQKFWLDLETKYVVFGKEVCPETGKMHLQGFVTMTRGYRWKAFKKLVGDKVHFEAAKAKDAGNYCMKDGEYTLKDSRNQGARSDLAAMGKMVEERKSNKEIYAAHPASYMRYYRAIEHLRGIVHMPDDKPVPVVRWHYGPAGTGKSRWAFDNFGKHEVWIQGSNRKWFDGYVGQKVAIIDDFRCETKHDLKQLLQDTDRYDMRVEVKNGHTYFRPEIIIITCPRHPNVECGHLDEQVDQVVRRCTEIVQYE